MVVWGKDVWMGLLEGGRLRTKVQNPQFCCRLRPCMKNQLFAPLRAPVTRVEKNKCTMVGMRSDMGRMEPPSL